MKNMSVRSREKSISATPLSKPPPKLDFIEEVEQLYQIMSQLKHETGFPAKFVKPELKKEERLRRTRSKSGRKRKIHPTSPIRKSKRIGNPQIQEDKYLELDRQPLWNPHKLHKKTNSKISVAPKLIETEKPNIRKKAKPNQALYQFYSEYCEGQNILSKKTKKGKQKDWKRQREQLLSEVQEQKMINLRENERKEDKQRDHDLTVSQVRGKQDQENDENCDPQLAVTQNDLSEWKPDKSFAQLIKIQQIMDNYFLFNSKYRCNRIIALQKLIDYVRDIEGYYFDRSRLDKLIWLNQNLYKLVKIEQEWFIKCPIFKEYQIEKRLQKTKISMIKFCRRQVAQIN